MSEVGCVGCGGRMAGAAKQRRRCDLCRAARARELRKPMRFLRAGEAPPSGQPRRYVLDRGYAILVWSLPTENVQAYEHQVVAAAGSGHHVHHIDGQKANNDPQNLQVLTPGDHAAVHGRAWHPLDAAKAQELYEGGRSTRAIADVLGCDPSTVYRSLARRRVAMRPTRGAANPNSKLQREQVEAIRDGHAQGQRQVDLAERFGVSQSCISSIVSHRTWLE